MGFPALSARGKRLTVLESAENPRSEYRAAVEKRSHRRLPGEFTIERLEMRTLLSAIEVNTVIDGLFPPSTGIVSLRNAIATANVSPTPTTITFDPKVFATPETSCLTAAASF
jgi:hypothetical protein